MWSEHFNVYTFNVLTKTKNYFTLSRTMHNVCSKFQKYKWIHNLFAGLPIKHYIQLI